MNTLGELAAVCARQYGEKTALVFQERRFSYLEMDRLSNKLGNSLKKLGIGKGDRVSIYSQNRWEWLIGYYGTLKIGAVVNPVNVMLTPEEVLYVVNDCGASVLLTAPDKAEDVIGIMDEAKTLDHVVVYGDEAPSPGIPFNRFLEEGGDDLQLEEVSALDLSTIGYTSGTTGHPKGAMLTHRGVMLNSKLTANVHMKTHEDIVVTSLPTAHVYGNVVMNGTFLTGGTLVLIERFEEEAVVDAISSHRGTMFEGVPAMYIMLLNHPSLDRCDFQAMRKCTVGGQTIAVNVMEEVEERFGCPLLELWGMTEISGLGTTHPLYGENRHGSIGVPLPYCSVRIADTEDPAKVLGPNEPGEMMIKGPIVMTGYYGNGNEQATRETIEPDGWLHTGDIARMDEDGYVYVVDRLKDMILTGGYNIYPAEIERILQQHPTVAMVAVGGVQDPVKGELAKAYIVPKEGEMPSEDEIIAYCREHLAPYKVPRSVRFVAGLPQTSTGKIMRRSLGKLDV
jgi:long-chain acyl-CoA synthetase